MESALPPPDFHAKRSSPIKLENRPLSEQTNTEFWDRVLLSSESLIAKLREVDRRDLAKPIENCHRYLWHQLCCHCHHHVTFPNRCRKWYCPFCAPRLSHYRKLSIEGWAWQIKQPKHVVLTSRNTASLTPQIVKRTRHAIRKLRRRKWTPAWRGGCWSLEVTNETRGWHLHAHLLIDADWIDTTDLSTRWGNLVGQNFAIVKVKDARQTDYLRELCKYVCDTTTQLKWSNRHIAEFIDAMSRGRNFGRFGSMFGQNAQVKRANKLPKAKCQCPRCQSDNLIFKDDNAWDEFTTLHGEPRELPI